MAFLALGRVPFHRGVSEGLGLVRVAGYMHGAGPLSIHFGNYGMAVASHCSPAGHLILL